MDAHDLDTCPTYDDAWTEVDEARAAGHPAYQADDFEPFDLVEALTAEAAEEEAPR